MRLLNDSDRVRARYAELLENFPGASVYQTPAWLRVWEDLGADLEFVEVDSGTMVPFVCRGSGALRRAYSLPFDTYGGPVTVHPDGPVSFERILEPLGNPSARVADFGARMASSNGALRPVASHIVDLTEGYNRVAARYTDANQRNLRQAREHAVRIEAVTTAEAPRQFYRLHLLTVRRHGARPLSRAFFDAVHARLGAAGQAVFYLAFHDGRVIAGNLVLRYRDRSYDWMWAYDERFGFLRATNLLIDRAIHDEIARGARELNLGASPNDRLGSVRFKQAFGAQPFPYAVYSHTAPLVAAARRVRRGVERLGTRVRYSLL